MEIRAKEDTFTNPSPKVGWGCHHVICAGDEAGRGNGGDRAGEGGWAEEEEAPCHSSHSEGSQGAGLSELGEGQTNGRQPPPPDRHQGELNSITPET